MRTLRFFTLVFSACCLISCAKEDIEEEVNLHENAAVYSSSYTDLEIEILREVNEYRKSQDLSELQALAEVSFEAEDHTTYMVEQGEISHDNFGLRFNSLTSGVGAKAVSENVAYGYRSAEAVVGAWLKSDGHRKNIEGDHSHFGISVLHDDNDRNYFTNIFIKR